MGSHVARALLRRGDEVRVTVRPTSNLEALEGLDVEQVEADITDRRAMRRAVKGCERVFHVAGSTNIRWSYERLNRVNVVGTRIVMAACLEEGVERVVHTSSISALGPAPRGSTADETQPFSGGGLDIPYMHAKHAGETEALQAAARGLDVVLVLPAHVLGAGDVLRSSTNVVRRFMLRHIPAYVDGTLNVVDVEDVAEGHVLAAEHGRTAERYILGNRNYSWDRLFADIGRFSGIEPPAVKLPYQVAIALAEAGARSPGGTPVVPAEVRAAAQRWAYRNKKALRELGWTTRPHEETVERTVAWWRDRLGDRFRTGGRQPAYLRLAGATSRRLGGLAARLGG